MEYVYAALLLHKVGKEVNEGNVKKVLTSAGAEVNDAKVQALVIALKDVNIEEAMQKAVAAPVAVVSEAKPAEAKKEEVKEEPKEDPNAAAGLGSLFG